MRSLKNLQIVAKTSGNDEIMEFLTNESVLADVRQACGKYIYNPNEVLTHRSVLSYKVKKILEKNGILWNGDPMDVSVTRVLMKVREHVARRATVLESGQPVTLPPVSRASHKRTTHR